MREGSTLFLLFWAIECVTLFVVLLQQKTWFLGGPHIIHRQSHGGVIYETMPYDWQITLVLLFAQVVTLAILFTETKKTKLWLLALSYLLLAACLIALIDHCCGGGSHPLQFLKVRHPGPGT